MTPLFLVVLYVLFVERVWRDVVFLVVRIVFDPDLPTGIVN